MANKIRIKRGYSADLPDFDEGEFGLEVDTNKLYIGGVNGNVCINPDPDSSLDETSHNHIENAVVAKAVSALDKRVKKLEPVIEYGIRWPHGASSPDCERVTRQDGVMKVGVDTGLSFTVEADGSFTSSYDDIYPWSDMQRVTLAGQVMVEVPKYYILLETVSGYDYIWVCKEKLTGYRPAAIFLQADGTTENDYYYIGAYETECGHLGKSQPGYSYGQTNRNLTDHRAAAQALGAGWGITTIAEICDFWQIIMPIEFGTRDVQAVAAGVTYLVDGIWYEDYKTEYGLEYSTGQCDDVKNHHGIKVLSTVCPDYSSRTGANCGVNPFVYRGIENPYGVVEKWVDGLTFYNKDPYVTNDRSAFKTNDVTGYTKVGYDIAKQYDYVKEVGYDPNVPYCRLPTELTSDSNSYYADYWDLGADSGYYYASWGGVYDGDGAGVWCFYVNYTSSYSYYSIVSRLSFSPV